MMGPLESWKTLQMISVQQESLRKGQQSILSELTRRFNVSPEAAKRYITFHTIRSHGQLFQPGPVTENVYIHAKLIIADDREAIISSANLNDRSLQGFRDSELGVWVKDEEMLAGRMGEHPYEVGNFCHSLRMSLWKEHLGISDQDSASIEAICDPIGEAAMFLWDSTSRTNTEIYETVFPFIPQDGIRTLAQLEDRKAAWASKPRREKEEVAALLEGVRGHLRDYPLYFLDSELSHALILRGMPKRVKCFFF